MTINRTKLRPGGTGRTWRHPAPIGTVATVMAVAAGVYLARTQSAPACGGTPPPTFCGKTYAFAKGVPNGNVAAGEAALLRVNTFHFVNVIRFGTACVMPPFSVNMTATLGCDMPPDGGPTLFGPFSVGEGRTVIPIDVPIPAGPARECTLTIDSTVSFSDGTVLQQSVSQPVCVVEPAPGFSTLLPGISVSTASPGGDIRVAHPGDQSSYTHRLTNNHPTQTFTGKLSIRTQNVAGLPAQLAGPNDSGNGGYAISDPGGADDYVVAFEADIAAGTCLQLPAVPHESTRQRAAKWFTVGPGQSMDVAWRSRSWAMCLSGSCNQATLYWTGYFSDGARGRACAGAVIASDRTVAGQHACDDSGFVGTVGASSIPGVGPGIVFNLATSGVTPTTYRVNFALDVAGTQMQINGVPINSATNFSNPTMLDGEHGVLNCDLSFIDPQANPTDEVTMVVPYVVQIHPSLASRFSSTLTHVKMIDGAPLGYADRYPFLMATLKVHDMIGSADQTLYIMQQFRAIGVEAGTFTGVDQQLVSHEVVQTGPDRFDTRLRWRTISPGAVPYVGFDQFSHLRAVSTPAGTQPLTASAAISPPTRCVGETFMLTGSASGGTPPYNFEWQRQVSLGAFESVGTRAVLSHAAEMDHGAPDFLPQIHTYRLRVTDAAGNEALSETVTGRVSCRREMDVSLETAPGSGVYTPVATGLPLTADATTSGLLSIQDYWDVTSAEPYFHGSLDGAPLADNRAHVFMANANNGAYLNLVLDSNTSGAGGSAAATWQLSGEHAQHAQAAVLDDGLFADPRDSVGIQDPGTNERTVQITHTWDADETDGAAIGPIVGAFQADLKFTGTSGLSGTTVVLAHTGGASRFDLPLDPLRTLRLTARAVTPAGRGDTDCDGVITFDDIDGFVAGLISAEVYQSVRPRCAHRSGDANNDLVVNFTDIDAFVLCLIRGTCDE